VQLYLRAKHVLLRDNNAHDGMMTTSWQKRLRAGIVVGIVAATLFTIIAAVALHFRSPTARNALHVTLKEVSLAYFVGAVFGGALVGICVPWVRNSFVAALLGVVASFPSFVMISAFMQPDAPWMPTKFVVALIASIVLGGGIGGLVYNDWGPRS